MTSIILQAAGGGGMEMILMLVAMFAIMYFLMIRPQQKQQKKIREFQNSLTEGTEVVTGSGVHGIVKKIDLVTNIVELEIAKGVVIRIDRGYVFQNTASVAAQPK